MSMNVTTSSSTNTTNSQVTTSSNITNKAAEKSFKEEMKNVVEDKIQTDDVDKASKTDDHSVKENNIDSNNKSEEVDQFNQENKQNDIFNSFDNSINYAQGNLDTILKNDITEMVDTISQIYNVNQIFDFETISMPVISMDSTDADFFLALTQNEEVSLPAIASQAQVMLNNNVDSAQVEQNFQVSKALLEALSKSIEKNQPLRIDFDTDISVILRVGKDGAIAANFIPGDKAVEQYLRNNISSLRNTFDEKELPYSDLSYSSRGGKQQKEQQRSKQQG